MYRFAYYFVFLHFFTIGFSCFCVYWDRVTSHCQTLLNSIWNTEVSCGRNWFRRCILVMHLFCAFADMFGAVNGSRASVWSYFLDHHYKFPTFWACFFFWSIGVLTKDDTPNFSVHCSNLVVSYRTGFCVWLVQICIFCRDLLPYSIIKYFHLTCSRSVSRRRHV